MARNTQTNLILLELVEGIKQLIDKPLADIIKESYAMSESEKAAYESAQMVIANAAGITSEIEKEKAQYADVMTRIKEAEKLEAFNADTLKDIRIQEKNIEKAQSELDARESAIAEKESALSKKLQDLAIFENSLIEKQNELSAFESKLNSAANAAANAIKGLS